MEGPGGEEKTAPTFNTRVLDAGSRQSPHPPPDNRGSERGGALRESPSEWAAVRGRQAGPGPQGRVADRRQGLTHSPCRAARSLPGSGRSLCSRTLAGPSPGGGGGNAGGGGCSTGSAQPEPSASLRLLYKPARNNES